MKKNYILSIYFGHHDSNVTFSSDEEILLYLEAERVLGKKHMTFKTPGGMMALIKCGLDHLNLTIEDFDTLYLAKWNNILGEHGVNILGKTFEPIMTSHHMNHIGSSYPAGFENSIVVCADGGSEDGTSKLYFKKGNEIQTLEDLNDTPMTGKFYGTLTQMIIWPTMGRAHNTFPGKTMGLAALGHDDPELAKLVKENWEEINKLHYNGVAHLLKIFNLTDDYSKPWEDKRRADLAYVGQKFWVEKFYEKILSYARLSRNISLVGGCALNVVLNSKLLESGHFDNVYTSPVSGDPGQSIGAILFHHPNIKCDYPFLGRGFGECEKLPEKLLEDFLSHKIIAWYQGRSEAGARALGHRSFLGLADSLEMRDRLSIKIKKREPYRPVASIIASEFTEKFFDFKEGGSPFMTFSPKVKQITKELAPAIVHFDDTSRVQTLSKKDNPILHEILLQIGEKTGAPIIMNSSFNVASEPIIDTPADAFRNFFNSDCDVLYINGERYEK